MMQRMTSCMLTCSWTCVLTLLKKYVCGQESLVKAWRCMSLQTSINNDPVLSFSWTSCLAVLLQECNSILIGETPRLLLLIDPFILILPHHHDVRIERMFLVVDDPRNRESHSLRRRELSRKPSRKTLCGANSCDINNSIVLQSINGWILLSTTCSLFLWAQIKVFTVWLVVKITCLHTS